MNSISLVLSLPVPRQTRQVDPVTDSIETNLITFSAAIADAIPRIGEGYTDRSGTAEFPSNEVPERLSRSEGGTTDDPKSVDAAIRPDMGSSLAVVTSWIPPPTIIAHEAASNSFEPLPGPGVDSSTEVPTATDQAGLTQRRVAAGQEQQELPGSVRTQAPLNLNGAPNASLQRLAEAVDTGERFEMAAPLDQLLKRVNGRVQHAETNIMANSRWEKSRSLSMTLLSGAIGEQPQLPVSSVQKREATATDQPTMVEPLDLIDQAAPRNVAIPQIAAAVQALIRDEPEVMADEVGRTAGASPPPHEETTTIRDFVSRSIHLRLHPEALGDVDVRLKVISDILHIELRLNDQATAEAVRSGQIELVHKLAAAGITVETMTIDWQRPGQQEHFGASKAPGGSYGADTSDGGTGSGAGRFTYQGEQREERRARRPSMERMPPDKAARASGDVYI